MSKLLAGSPVEVGKPLSPTGAEPERLDLRGLRCPLPVLKARKKLAGMPPGARLVIETTDPLAGIDIPAFAADDGHRLVAVDRSGNGHRFTVERGG